MKNNKKILCVIPARGGSKGIPLKNIQKIMGKTLIKITADCVKKINLIDKCILSTDNQDIANEAIACGIEVPFMRPSNISGDRISDFQVLEHALLAMEKIDKKEYDYILMLQPTSPLRSYKDVISCLNKIIDENWDAVWTVSKNDSKNHPLKQLKIDGYDSLSLYDKAGENIIARQELNPLFYRNGVAYVMTRNCLLNQKKILGLKTAGFIVNSYQISIDTPLDLELAEFFLKKK
tara:strand:- start:463 stop:1167 length:705 start_codon:yes stop_codon:yes gene_type:complete